MSNKSPECPDTTNPENLGVEDLRMESSDVTSYPTTWNTTSDDCLDMTEPKVAIVLNAHVETEDEMDFDKTEVFVLFRKKDYRFQISVGIASNIQWLAVRVFYTAGGLNLVQISALLVKWRDHTHSIQNTSLKSASNIHVNANCIIMISV